ncbi:cell wall-active antibiotics response protein LiaF [Fictibacillus barbaricus]|uniref:Cell wall-active antibiotics response protein n=1 Tax=Fictibacillus barbaricus TaxID=182136 RepID=A0ABS2ZEL4_9BACL|nr:cell wall-active antibiotics response protein LiaF [Fictibacillus barbaricus]MBN3546226.1 cell wall-active antibiotics response protein [Fictibacillus barbaricus]
MLNMKRSDLISWGLLIAFVLVLLEATLNGEGILFALLFSAALMFFGRKRMPKRSGKIMFWVGVFIGVMNILSMYTFKLLLVAIIIYVIVQFYQSKQNPVFITPHVDAKDTSSQEDVYKKEPLLKNMILGTQQTPEHVYEWNDINIQCGPGDTIIDLNQTILPDGEALIMIRGFIGNITVYVPYEVETAVSHSVFVGNTKVFDQNEPKMFNQTLSYRTKGYMEAEKKVKIVTSLFAGSLEVRRV